MIKQVNIEDVRPGDIVWDIHDQEWQRVDSTEERNPVEININIRSGGTITAERGHRMFLRYDEANIVVNHEEDGVMCIIGGFRSNEAAQEYITNLQDTFTVFEDLNYDITHEVQTSDGWMEYMEFAQEEQDKLG